MIDHLTLVIAGACLVAFAYFIDQRDPETRWSGALFYVGLLVFILGTIAALMGLSA